MGKSLFISHYQRRTGRVSFVRVSGGGGGGGLKSLAQIFSPLLARKSKGFAPILLAC